MTNLVLAIECVQELAGIDWRGHEATPQAIASESRVGSESQSVAPCRTYRRAARGDKLA
jgi:hypothetical protein